MKKSLLIAVAAVLATSAYAEDKAQGLVKNTLPKRMVKMEAREVSEKAPKAVTRSFSDGVYYVPQGMLYRGWNLDGFGSGYSMVGIAPFTEVTFKNMMGNASKTKWFVNGNEIKGSEGSINANGDLVTDYPARGLYYAPTISDGIITYSFGDNNILGKRQNAAYATPIAFVDTVATFSVVDDHGSTLDNGQYYSNTYGWGSLDTDNLYGSGTIAKNGRTCYAVMQYFPALHSNMSVECIALEGCTFTKPIKNGAKLKLEILPLYYDSKSNKYRPNYDEPMETIYATETDTLGFSAEDASKRNSKTIYGGKVVFSKKVEDDFGATTTENITIPANKPFAIYVSGFEDQVNIDFGVYGLEGAAEEVFDEGIFQCYDATEDVFYNHYYGGLAVKMYLNGIFDKVVVFENEVLKNEPANIQYNVLRVSADGTTVTTEGSDANSNIGWWLIRTAMPFFDDQEGTNYELELNVDNSDDWVTFNVDPSEYDGDNWPFFTFIKPVCKPLPTGVTKRAAAVYVKGRGTEGNKPLYILQGDATIADGIAALENAKANNGVVYNLQGQKVSMDAKGLLIKNGKKFFNK
ncbi:MAG: hypothetical protein SPF12_05645 [Prevotella sp.]|nr:hypothetical protein [Prevotella sp.]